MGLRRVVIDGRLVVPSGIARYTHSLVRAMAVEAPEVELILLSRVPSGIVAPNVVERVVPIDDHSFGSLFTMHRVIDGLRADVLHSPFALAPLFGKTPLVLTVHDLMWIRSPGLLINPPFWRWGQALYVSPWARLSLRRARAVITPTHHVAGDLRLLFGERTPRIDVSSEGVEEMFRLQDPPPPPAARRYVMAYGNARPYKNLPGLLRGFAIVARAVPDVELVLLIRGGAEKERRRADIARLGLEGRVVLRDLVSDDELVTLLNGAAALAFPSFYEGFGLPIVEAMACGCPVVTSTGGGTAEVAGDAAELCDPVSDESIAAALVRVLTDPARAAALRELGLARVKTFPWSGAARITLAVYRRVAEETL